MFRRGVARLTDSVATGCAVGGKLAAMAIKVRTHISSSRGNCIQVDCEGATLLLDCGFWSQRACHAVLDGIHGDLLVLVSHAHKDHLSDSGLKAISRRAISLRAHQCIMDQLGVRHDLENASYKPKLTAFTDMPFHFGPFLITPVAVRHAPGFPNYAFVVECGTGSAYRKLVICTDLCHAGDIAAELAGADMIYLESNHDMDLLRLNPNPASRFHLSNPHAAELVCDSVKNSGKWPQHILLGHLSQERNRPEIALQTLRDCFGQSGMRPDCTISAAPAMFASAVLVVE